MQAMHQIDYSSSEESKSYLQTLQSDTKSPLDSQPMDSSLSIVDETPSVFKPTGNRRKLGSSRRNKGKQHVLESVTEPTEEVVERTCGDEEKMPFATETMRQEELKEQTGSDFKPTEKTRKIRSAVKEEENIDQTSDKDTTLSQNTMDSGNTVTTDKGDILKSSEEVNEVEEKLIKEPGHLTPRTGYDKVKMDLVQSAEASFWKDDSGTKNTSYHDDNVSNRPVAYDLLYQEEVLHVQNTEALPCDTDSLGQEMNMQHTNYVRETVGNVTIIDQSTEAETSMDAQGPGRVEAGEECKYPANKYLAAQGINTTNGVTHALLFSGAQNKTETMASFDIGHEENLKAMPAVNVSQESGISLAADSSNSRQDIQETPLVGNSDIMQGERREMGSTCKTQLNRKHEGETDNKDTIKGSNLAVEAGVRNLDRMEEVEELSLKVTAAASQKENANPPLSTVDKEQQEIYETGFVHDKWLKLQSSTSDLQTIKSNTIPDIDDSMALLPEQAASHNEVDVSPVRIVQRADVEDSEGNVDVSVEDFRSSELQTSSLVIGRKRQSINQLLPPNAEGTDSGVAVSFCETETGTQNDGQSPEGNKEIQDQASKSTESPSYVVAESVARGGAGEQHENVQASAQESSNVTEGAHSTDCEMKTEGSHLSSTNRRRKMGSTRRNLGSRSKVKDLHQKQEVDNNEATATKCGDLLTESASGIFEKEPQPHNEQKDSDSKQSREKVFETVEFRHTGESQVKPLAQQTDEEIPDSLSQLAETEHHQNPDYLPANPPTSSKHDDMSELAAGGRRRKMGSHRKSHGHQKYEDQSAREDRMKDAQQGRDVGSLTDERGIKKREEHGEEPSGMDRISEVDESDKKSPNISISNKTEHSRPLSEEAPKRETPVQHPHADIHLRQKSENKISLGDSRGADVRSKSFNVLLVGNSSVGKTSFMKRAQSGKFSLDLAASVGLDSCMWTVVVDGKPVVLRLWDTAGQERFHSITTQVFHKAQAILLMYDITSSQSFSAVSYWANCIQEGAAEDVTIILLGNKSDCGERQVKTQEGEVLAEEYNFEFMECSAATGENVIHSLETVARMLSQMVDTRQEAMVLHKEPPQKKRSGCC
uniref:Uncharacterized protein n=1 Tax=Scophthalmus maximus TaxID=52904 RepID=A0A8D3CQ67_SCOMX